MQSGRNVALQYCLSAHLPDDITAVRNFNSPSSLGLNLSHCHHLLPQVVLVLADGSIPSSDGLVLTDHDVLGNLVQ